MSDQVTSQGQPASTPTTTTQSSLLNQNSLYGGSLAVPQQQGTPVVPMMVNQDQIQNLLNLLNQGVSNNQASASNERTLINRENQVSSVPPIPKSEGDADQNKSHPEATTQPDGSRSQSLNYEIATLLASLHNTGRGTAIDSTSSSQQLQGLIQPQQQTPSTPIPQPHTDSPSQEEILQAFFRSMNNPYQNRNVHHVQHQSPTVEGRMLSQYQTHTQTPESSSNPYLQPISQMDYSPNNPFLLNAANMSPSTVRPTNTLDQDVFRLLLMSSAPNSNMGIPIPQFPTILSHHHDSSRDATLNNLILQSLGLAPPPPPPPPPQLGSNVLNMLLGQIAMNPSTFPMNTASFAPSVASHQKNEEDEEGGEKQAPPDDSSSDTCELANVDPIPMSTDMDDDHVSKYQCLVRKQIQFFEANDGDVGSTAQGRNKPIVLGQVRTVESIAQDMTCLHTLFVLFRSVFNVAIASSQPRNYVLAARFTFPQSGAESIKQPRIWPLPTLPSVTIPLRASRPS